MLSAGAGGVRVLRALSFVAAVVLLTVVGHEWAGGSASPVGIVALGALCWPVALLGSARQRRLRHLFPALAVGQLVGHTVLTFFSGAATATLACTGAVADHVHALTSGCLQVAAATPGATGVVEATGAAATAATAATAGMTGMTGTVGMPGMTGMTGTVGMPGMTGMTGTPAAGAVMLLGHLVAALLLALLLRHGESLLWHVVDAVVRRGRPRLPRLVATPLIGTFHRAAVTHRHLVLVVPGRGPPALAA